MRCSHSGAGVDDRGSARPRILVPVKPGPAAKSRLAPVLEPAARQALSRWMLDRVLAAAAACLPGSLSVVGGDPSTGAVAARHGARLIPELGHDLNDTLARGLALVRGEGLAPCVILAADLPLLAGDDVAAMVDASEGGEVAVVAPSHDGTGTNGLVIPRGAVLRPAFGPASRARHQRLLHAGRHRVRQIVRPGLALDVDEPEDLDRLLRAMTPAAARELTGVLGASGGQRAL